MNTSAKSAVTFGKRRTKMATSQFLGTPLQGNEGRYGNIHKDDLFLDMRYQREAPASFNPQDYVPSLFGILVVADMGKDAPKGERWAIVDGGRRWRGAKKTPSIEYVLCDIYEVKDYNEAALMYYLLDTRKKKMSSLQRFKASVPAGEPVSNAINDLFKQLHVSPNTAKKGGSIASIAKCESGYKKDPSSFKQALRALAIMSRTENYPITVNLLRGVPYLYRNVIGSGSARFTDRLITVGAKELDLAAKRIVVTEQKGDRLIATQMLIRINKYLKVGDEWKLSSIEK
jgi:hypothetical protein